MIGIINLVLLPLLSGFVLSYSLMSLRYRSMRLNGYSLLLQCVVIGLFLYLISHLLVVGVKTLIPYLSMSESDAAQMAGKAIERGAGLVWGVIRSPIRGVDMTLIEEGQYLSFIFAIAVSVLALANEIINKPYRTRKELSLSARLGGRAAVVARKSLLESNEVLITLKSRKCYVGVVTGIPAFIRDVPRYAIRFYPIASGFRHSETQQFFVTHTYRMYYGILTEDPAIRLFRPDPESGSEVDITHEYRNELLNNFSVHVFWDEIESIASFARLPSHDNVAASKVPDALLDSLHLHHGASESPPLDVAS